MPSNGWSANILRPVDHITKREWFVGSERSIMLFALWTWLAGANKKNNTRNETSTKKRYLFFKILMTINPPRNPTHELRVFVSINARKDGTKNNDIHLLTDDGVFSWR